MYNVLISYLNQEVNTHKYHCTDYEKHFLYGLATLNGLLVITLFIISRTLKSYIWFYYEHPN